MAKMGHQEVAQKEREPNEDAAVDADAGVGADAAAEVEEGREDVPEPLTECQVRVRSEGIY